jgi:intergrase/recombinase
MQQAGMRVAHLTQLLRQPEGEHLQAIKDTLNGDLRAAFHKMADKMVAIDSPELRVHSMARHYADLPRSEKNATLVLLPTQAQCETFSVTLRPLLKAKQELGPNDTSVTVLTAKNLSVAETTSAHHYLPGDVVRFNQNHKKLSIKAQHYYRVATTDPESNQVTRIQIRSATR